MKRYRYTPSLDKVEFVRNVEAKDANINMCEDARGKWERGTVRVYITARDELDAWIKAKKWWEEQEQT